MCIVSPNWAFSPDRAQTSICLICVFIVRKRQLSNPRLLSLSPATTLHSHEAFLSSLSLRSESVKPSIPGCDCLRVSK
uniref:Uncharacterized protein n=1 Tax=Helianthus annuus TaxID=4232 RepID=A0A251UCC5_HELAN